MESFVEFRDFSFSFFILFQSIVIQALTNWDKLLLVCDSRVKVFCLFSGATRCVPSASANLSNKSYELLLCKLCGSCWELPNIQSGAGLGHPFTFYAWDFAALRVWRKPWQLEGGKRPWGREENTFTCLTLLTQQQKEAYNPICLHKCEYSACVVNKYSSGAHSQSTE